MARLALGVTPVPHTERTKIYRENLARAGGKRIIAELGPQAVQALHLIVARDGCSIKDALAEALINYAKLPDKPAPAKK